MKQGIRHLLGKGLPGLLLAGGTLCMHAATPAPAPATDGRALPVVQHALTLGRLPLYQGEEYRGIFLPPSIQFKHRTEYLNRQEKEMLREIAILGGAREIMAVRDTNNTLVTRDPHGLQPGDKVELIASGPIPGGLKGRASVDDPQVFYYVGAVTANTLQLHTSEADALTNLHPLDLEQPIEEPLRPATLYLSTANLDRRNPPALERNPGADPGSAPVWDSIFRRLKIILESDATDDIKAEAKSVALLSLAQRADEEDAYAPAHALFRTFATNHALSHPGTQPPISLPQILLRQAELYREDRRWQKATMKYYDVQRSLLARPVAGETQWQWLILRARRGIGDVFYEDRLPGHTEDTRQWAIKAGGIQLNEVKFTSSNDQKKVFQHVMVTDLPHGLKDGDSVHLMPLGITHRALGVEAGISYFVKVVRDNEFIILEEIADVPEVRRGINLQFQEKSLVFFLPGQNLANEPVTLQKMIAATPLDVHDDGDLVNYLYPRMVKLYAAVQTYQQIRRDVAAGDIASRFSGARLVQRDQFIAELKDQEDTLMTNLAALLRRDEQPLKREQDLGNLQPDDPWTVVFDHLNDIIQKNAVPVSAIVIDLERDLLRKQRHGFKTGDAVRFSGPLPRTANVEDLDRSSIMYVRTESADHFSLHATASEAASDLSPVDFNGTSTVLLGRGQRKEIPFVTMVTLPYRENALGVALVNLAVKREAARDYAQALQYLAEYRERYLESPLLPEILLRQAHLFRLMGQPEMAISKFYETMTGAARRRSENLIKYRRTILTAQVRIADTYYANVGDYPEAIKLYRQLLKDPDEELLVENTRFKLIHAQMRNAQRIADDARDDAKLRDNPGLPKERDDAYRELIAETTRFLVEHPRSQFRAQIRYLRAMAHERLDDRHNADKDFRTLIETPSDDDARGRWGFWKAKAGLDLADRSFASGNYDLAAGLYHALLTQNRTLETQVKLHQQIALCHAELKDIEAELRGWQRINEVWVHQQGRVKDLEDGVEIVRNEMEALPEDARQDHEARIKKMEGELHIARATLTPEIQLIVHMAQARERLLAFRKQMAAETAPQPTAADANGNPNVAGGGN